MKRYIRFEGIVNGRDLGGIVNAEGKTIRKGLLLRTAHLSQATERDLTKLKEEYRLSLAIDLRTKAERSGHPDRLPDHVEYLCLPIFDEATAGITREDGTPTPYALPDMVQLYRTMIASPDCKRALSSALMAIFAHDYDVGAALWHCTAGKDRCGVVSSLVLAALGVSRDEIMRDYAVNDDTFIAQADALYRRALRSGRPESVAATVRDVFLVLPKYMESSFAAIDEEFGSTDRYLIEGLGIPEDVLANFRIKLLV